MYRGILTVIAVLAGGATLAPTVASAETLVVNGGPGLDAGSLCPAGPFCPSFGSTSNDLALSGLNNPVSGSFVYDPGTNKISFSLTLNTPVTFTGTAGTEILQAGTVFSGSNIAVTAPNGAGGVVQGSGTGAATLYSSLSGQPIQDSSASITIVSCTTVGAGQCGVSFGPTGLGTGTLGAVSYDGSLTFNVNVAPVPLPAGAWLMMAGLGGLFGLRRREAGLPRGALA